MSYCRWFEGDIYLYGDVSYNAICCMWCCLKDKEHTNGELHIQHSKLDGYKNIECCNVVLHTYSDAIKHMEEHRHVGDRAPYKRVIEHLKEDQLKEGDIIDYSDIIEDSRRESVRDNYIWNPMKTQFRWS